MQRAQHLPYVSSLNALIDRAYATRPSSAFQPLWHVKLLLTNTSRSSLLALALALTLALVAGRFRSGR
jgi:hypothetical protein